MMATYYVWHKTVIGEVTDLLMVIEAENAYEARKEANKALLFTRVESDKREGEE